MNTPKNNPNNRRRKYIINPRLQIPWVIWIFLLALAIIACFIVAIALYIIPRENQETLDPMIWDISPLIVIVILWILLTVLAWIVILMSHKFAGPIYRFQSVVKAITNGNFDLPPINLRKRDEFKDVAEDFNKMIEVLRVLNNKLKEVDKEIKDNTDALTKIIDDESIEISKQKQAIKECVEKIANAGSKLTKI